MCNHLHETDSQRFEALYLAHYAAVLRYVARRIERYAAEEIVAETFTIAWRRLEHVPRHDELPSAARHGAQHAGQRAARRHPRQRQGARARGDDPRAAIDDPADALAERDAVVRAFTTLSEPDREALRLVAWDGLSLATAARVAGTTRLAFAMRVSRARRPAGRRPRGARRGSRPHPRTKESTS